MADSVPRIKTPCIGVCSTGIGDDVCRGCKRFCHEIIDWNGYSQEQKGIIDQRLDSFLVQVMGDKLHIVNAELLRWQLDTQQLRYPAHKDPYIWLFQLLRAGAGQIQEPRQYGFVVDANWQHLGLPALREVIDNEFYQLSLAHYERYIGRFVQKRA